MWDAGRAAGAGGRGRARAPMRVEEAGGGATAMARVGTREGGQAGRRREGQSMSKKNLACVGLEKKKINQRKKIRTRVIHN